jgi:hypothetical protein
VGVFGIPHIIDSVVLTIVSLGSHIAAFCRGVNVGFPWAWAVSRPANSVNVSPLTKIIAIAITPRNAFLA